MPPSELTRLPVRFILSIQSRYHLLCSEVTSQIILFFSIAGKGFWSEMLGVGDFYYELGVQIIEVCLALKHRNGGL